MSNPQAPYCTAPWRGLTVREHGGVQTCCAADMSVIDLNHDSPWSYNQSPVLKEIQTALQNSEQHENCRLCYKQEENSGVTPLRNSFNRYYPEVEFGKLNLSWIDLRWNNKCNLTCLYCSETFSSAWEKKKGIIATSARKNYEDELLEWLLENISDIKELMLVGGEPLLIKQNKTLIEQLDPSIRISVITNLSMPLENNAVFKALLNHPKENVIWSISGENTHHQFEYVRNRANWELFAKNIKLLTSHTDNVAMAMVYSVFNALDLLAIVQEFYDLGVKKLHFQPINRGSNRPLMVNYTSQEFIEQARAQIDELRQWHKQTYRVDQHFYPMDELDQVYDNLALIESASKQELLDKIFWLDKQNESKYTFSELWPTEYNLLLETLEEK